MEQLAEVLCEEQKAVADALYWTGSTVAQSLGGAMGLLAAFVLYRIQTLARDKGMIIKRLKEAKDPNDKRVWNSECDGWWIVDDLRNIANHFKQAKYKDYEKQYRTCADQLVAPEMAKSRLKRWLMVCLVLTAATILFSLGLTVFASDYASHYRNPWPLLIADTFLAALCLASYVWLIWVALADRSSAPETAGGRSLATPGEGGPSGTSASKEGK